MIIGSGGPYRNPRNPRQWRFTGSASNKGIYELVQGGIAVTDFDAFTDGTVNLLNDVGDLIMQSDGVTPQEVNARNLLNEHIAVGENLVIAKLPGLDIVLIIGYSPTDVFLNVPSAIYTRADQDQDVFLDVSSNLELSGTWVIRIEAQTVPPGGAIDVTFDTDDGDSGVTITADGDDAMIVEGTEAQINDFFAGNTTGFFQINFDDEGNYAIEITATAPNNRDETKLVPVIVEGVVGVEPPRLFFGIVTSAADEEYDLYDVDTGDLEFEDTFVQRSAIMPVQPPIGTPVLVAWYNPSTPIGSAEVIAAARSFEIAAFNPDIQIFTTTGSNTWNKPDGAVTVNRHLIGAGAGGGSGRRGAAASERSGGGGGGGGGYSFDTNPASEFGSSETVTVGAGGAGGATNTVDDSNGAAGSNGGNTSMTATGTGGATLTANGGTGGGAGTSTAGGAGGSGGTGSGGQNGAAGGAGGDDTQNPAVAGSDVSAPLMAGAGGGGGGGITTGNATIFSARGGSSGGLFGSRGEEQTGAGVLSGFPGRPSQAGMALIAGTTLASFGSGGGGGGGNTVPGAGSVQQGGGGAAALFGGGGGGGSGTLNGGTQFNGGGAGANGCAIIITLFE